ncbi:pyruvate kinase [Scaptodrosophila lebanonensis]|uniref:Pyruvate kinase n=1 Tax=Drosophila lebanonensis TaxID=7225 RepID=A0A6J2T4I0_DROLE|nr:pyruvate kinase [Scaptodrosophila lebanonensis]
MKLMDAGMRVVRLNFSHGSHENHSKTIEIARKAIICYSARKGYSKTVAIALDTKGPEIRTGRLAGSDTGEVELKQGDKIKLSTKKDMEDKGSKDVIYVDYPNITKILKPGNHIFIDDGLISLLVKEIAGEELSCEVENGGKLGSRKGVNLPGVPVDLPAVTEKDKADLKFGVQQKVDMIFASFIRNAKALEEIRKVLGPEGKHIKIISKIENQEGMQNIDAIIEASDGIMVARGDLGIEIKAEEVPLAQKAILAKCNKVGKPVVCATQMLDSMTTKPRSTRAEASDVANAIFDGADCVMLSGETAKGKYPVETVKCMADICSKVEAVLWYERIQNDIKAVVKSQTADEISAVSSAIAEAATISQAKAIIVGSPCALISHIVSQFRPNCPIVLLTGCPVQARQSVIFRGVYPIVLEEMATGCTGFRRVLQKGINIMAKMKMLEVGKTVTVVIVDAMKADKISFRLLSIKQKCTKAEDEKLLELQCQELAKKDKCKEMAEKQKAKAEAEKKKCEEQAAKDKCKAMAEKDKCKKPDEKEKCGDDAKEKAEKEKCKAMAEKEKCKKSNEKEKCGDGGKDKGEKDKCKAMAEKEKCKAMAEKEKCKAMVEKDKCKQKKNKCGNEGKNDKCKEMAEQEKCKKMAEEEKCNALAEKEKCGEKLSDKEKAEKEKCKMMALKKECQALSDKEKCANKQMDDLQKYAEKCREDAIREKCKERAQKKKAEKESAEKKEDKPKATDKKK